MIGDTIVLYGIGNNAFILFTIIGFCQRDGMTTCDGVLQFLSGGTSGYEGFLRGNADCHSAKKNKYQEDFFHIGLVY